MSDQDRYNISFEDLEEAHQAAGIDADKTEATWQHLGARQPEPIAPSGVAPMAWYFGAALMLVPMGWLLVNISNDYGASGMFGLSLFYGAAFAFVANILSAKPGLRVATGLLYVLATCMTPFVVGAAEQMSGHSTTSTMSNLIVALATLVVGNVFTARARISFVCLPPLLAGIAATELAAEMLFGSAFSIFNWDGYHNLDWALIAYGAVACAVSFIIDRRANEDDDYAYWGYGVGAITVWIGLSMLTKGEAGYALYALAGLGSIFLSMVLARPVFGVTGGMAVLFWVMHLLESFLGHSTLFMIFAIAIGAAVFASGLWYFFNQQRLDKAARRFVPKMFRPGLPGEKDDE